MNTLTRATAVALLVSLVTPSGLLAARRQATQQSPPPPQTEQRLPVDMDKIREALKQNPQMRLQTDELRFYVDIIGRLPTFKEIVGDFDLKHGVVPGAPMTHEEYLSMVNREFNQSGGITALDTLQTALTSYAMIAMVKRAYEEYKKAQTERERRAIQERIERELRELEKRRGGGR
ncbi:MAG TPA: hypothetical protein VMN81_14340 [Vicinamibacterales bacterium]|nr:hypothetical protein [Vicinamibacterales bacterium]